MLRNVIAGLILFVGAVFGGALAQTVGGSTMLSFAQAAWLSIIGTISGTPSTYACLASANCYAQNQIHINADTMSASGVTGPYALDVIHHFGGGMTGGAGGVTTELQMTSATGNTNTNYVGEKVANATNVNETGSSLFARNALVWLSGSASGWNQIIGDEIDIALAGTSSANDKIGMQIIQTSIDAQLASRSNQGILLGNQTASLSGWDCGFCVGAYSGYWPFTATSTMIGCWPHAVARNGAGSAVPTSAGCGTTLFGVDLSNVTFAAGGGAFLAPLHTPASSSETCRQGLIEWDASFIYICTASNTLKRAALSTF